MYDKNPRQIQAAKAYLRGYKFLETIETGTNAMASFIRTRQLALDIVFWGITNRESLDFELFEKLLSEQPQRPVVNLINFRSVSFVSDLLEHGAFAVIQKTQKPHELENVLDSVFGQLLEVAPLHLDLKQPRLSDRQIEVFQAMAGGLGNSEICSRLSLRYETVRSHMKNMARELNSRGREQLVAQGFRSRVLY